jgi:putative aldouronate transport system substrate-binding protein
MAITLALSLITAVSAESKTYDKDGVTNATGYPITKEPIELNAVWLYNAAQDISKMSSVLDWIEKETNIRIKVKVFTEADQVALMFASGDYPDFALNIGSTPLQRSNAVDAGDLVELNDLIDQFAPTWKAFLEKETLTNDMTLISSKRYTLPWCNFAAYDRKLRDCWIINESWVKELGLAVPATMAEYETYLQAVKDHAGKGTIPESAIPLYFMFGNWVGGEYNIYAQFGVYTSSADFLIVQDGKVQYQAVNPDIKEPLKWMQSMYTRGLIGAECFTDDWATYLTRRQSNPHTLGSHFAYSIYVDGLTCFGPLDSGNGKASMLVSQSNTPNNPHAFMMFANNEYPAATMRLCEFIVENAENMTNATVGLKGEMWDYDADGKRAQTKIAFAEDTKAACGFWNQFVGILDSSYYEKLAITDYIDGAVRARQYFEKYDGKTVPQEMNFVGGTLDTDKEALRSQYATDIKNFQKETFARWITTNADIDAEWDAYVTQLQSYKLDDWLALQQEAYDLVH